MQKAHDRRHKVAKAAAIAQPIAFTESTEPDGEIDKTDPVVPVLKKAPRAPRERSMSSPWSKVPSNALFSTLIAEPVAELVPAVVAQTPRPKIALVGPELDFEADFDLSEDSLTDTEVMEFK